MAVGLAFLPADESLPILDMTVGGLVADSAARAPGKIALKQRDDAWNSDADRTWTYAGLLADSYRLANFLLDLFRSGERVALWGINSADWTLYQLAAAHAGLVLVTLNPALRIGEMSYLLPHCAPSGIIIDRMHRGVDLEAIVHALASDVPTLREILFTSDLGDHLAAGTDGRPDVRVSPDDDAMILYTSGTTGRPKGVRLHHRGIVNNAALGSLRYELREGSVWLNTLPLFHVGGSVTITLGCMAQLSTNIVVPGFEAGAALRLCSEERVALLPVVPTMLIAMLGHPTFFETDLSALEILLTGGTVITPEFVRTSRERLGSDVQVMFGQTEAGGAMCKTLRTDPADRIATTVGIPYPHTALKIVRCDGGAIVGRGEIGEIQIRSPFMMKGYFENPEATSAAFDDESYLRTGDLGLMTAEGYIQVTGRLKDLVIRGGENIYPREVEDALSAFPDLVEAAVFGVPHPQWGEEVVAVVRMRDEVEADFDAMTQWLRERVARHKVPRAWKAVRDFPRTPSGKIQKFEMIDWFAGIGVPAD